MALDIRFAEPDPQLTEIADTAGALLTRLGGLEIARGLLDGDDTLARVADAALLEFGLLDLARRDGGEQPGSLRYFCGVLGALGRSTLAVRYLPSLVHMHLTSALRVDRPASWGGSVAFWSTPDPEFAWVRNSADLRIRIEEDTVRLDGRIDAVLGDVSAGTVLVPLRVAGEDLIVEADASTVNFRTRPSLSASMQVSDLMFDSVAARIVGRGEAARAALRAAHRLALCGLAAAQAEAAEEIATRATSYARERFQFGLPIGSFQAIKHRCVDMYIEAQLAKSIADGAAAEDGNPDAPAIAKAFCSEAYRFVATKSVQIHGGIGITWEHLAHLFLRDAHATATLLGGAAAQRRQLAEAA